MAMTVFKIQQAGTSPGKSEKKIEAVIPESKQDTDSAQLSEDQQPGVNPLSTAAPAEPAAGGAETDAGAAAGASVDPKVSSTEDQALETKMDPKMMVKVDGPVGRLFTDALNKMLATEGYITMLPNIEADQFDQESQEEELPKNLVQVYCWRTDAINTSDLVELTNNITRHTDRQFVIAMESTGRVSNGIGVLEDLQKMPNVKLCYSMESAVRHVQGKLL